ncbi:pentapeptide repeat-containing protein [Halalkalicoccus salilacus]|uniref:pentapeptide repeat-containing protein n=1 Tax=Halalkalicoccus salilacus TaxID=3117459 RepID=UPI00300F7A94
MVDPNRSVDENCEYEVETEALPGDVRNWSCPRSVWTDSEHDDPKKCIWHTDTDNKSIGERVSDCDDLPEQLHGISLCGLELEEEADFSNCTLIDADLRGADLEGANMRNADLRGADLEGADLRHIDFTDADLRGADLIDSKLVGSDFTDADLFDADLSESNLQGAIMKFANLWKTDLTDVDLYGSVLTDARIDYDTEFGNYCSYDPIREAKDNRPRIIVNYITDLYSIWHEFRNRPWSCNGDEDFVTGLNRAAGTYRKIEIIAQRNGLTSLARHAFTCRKDVHRREYAEQGQIFSWIRGSISNLVVRYGESPLRVVWTALLVIVSCPIFYFFTGGLYHSEDDTVLSYTPTGLDLSTTIDVFREGFYFSGSTFLGLTYTNYQPVGLARYIAIIEAGLGLILFALLVFAFGQRAKR